MNTNTLLIALLVIAVVLIANIYYWLIPVAYNTCIDVDTLSRLIGE